MIAFKLAWRGVCDEALNPRTWIEAIVIVLAMLATVTALAAWGCA